MQNSESLQVVYDFIKKYAEAEDCVPTIREICEGTNIKSTSTVHNKINQLILLKKLENRGHKTPAYKLTGYKLVNINK